MTTIKPLSKLLILVRDGGKLFKYAKADLLDGGNGLLLYDYQTREKVSRHSDGNVFSRVAGSGHHPQPTTTLPFSEIRHEVVRTVPIRSDATFNLPLCERRRSSNAFVFSSTVMRSNGTFAAEVVDETQLPEVLAAWQDHPDFVSAQTCRPTGHGKTVILTVLNARSA